MQDINLLAACETRFSELVRQMPAHIDEASVSETRFLTVTKALMDVASYILESLNYQIYEIGNMTG